LSRDKRYMTKLDKLISLLGSANDAEALSPLSELRSVSSPASGNPGTTSPMR
jgi:hypothetical protein